MRESHFRVVYYECERCLKKGETSRISRKDDFYNHLACKHRLDPESPISVALAERSIKEGEPLPEQLYCPENNCKLQFEGSCAWDHWIDHVARHVCSDGSQLPAHCFEQEYAPSNGILREERFKSSLPRYGGFSRHCGIALSADIT